MYCSRCGNYIEDNMSFCPGCGNPTGNNGVTDGQSAPYNTGPYPYNQGVNMGYPQQMYNGQQQIYTAPVQPVVPAVINVQQSPPKTKSANGYCAASFVLSICCFFIVPVICGAAAVILGVVGLITYDESKHTSKWMAIVGIVVGAAGFIIGFIAISFAAALIDCLTSLY